MNHFLVYWKPDTVVDNEESDMLGHSASNQYGRLRPGDVLWIVTSEGPEDLLLVGRQKVDRIVGQYEAERILGPYLWKSDYHVITDAPEQKAYLDLSPWAFHLEFDGVVTSLPERFTGRNLQTMRRLDYSSANLLERLWSKLDEAVDISEE